MGQHQAHLSVYTKIAQHEANLPIDEQQHDEIWQSTASVVLAHGGTAQVDQRTINVFTGAQPLLSLRPRSAFTLDIPFHACTVVSQMENDFLIHRRGERGTDRSPISPSTVYTWALAISHDTFPVDPPRTEKGERWIEWKGYLPVLFDTLRLLDRDFELESLAICNWNELAIFPFNSWSDLLNLSRIIYNAMFLQQDGRFSYKLDRYFSDLRKKNRPREEISWKVNSYKFLSIDLRLISGLEVDGRTTSVKSLASLNHKLLATIPQARPTNKIGAETREMKGR